MKSCTMTESETKGWENEDEQTAHAVRREVRAKARGLGGKVEIFSADGIVMDVVEA